MNEAVGEFLADRANQVLHPPGRLILTESTGDADRDAGCVAVVKLALDLRARPALLMRSIVEGWDGARIVRELY